MSGVFRHPRVRMIGKGPGVYGSFGQGRLGGVPQQRERQQPLLPGAATVYLLMLSFLSVSFVTSTFSCDLTLTLLVLWCCAYSRDVIDALQRDVEVCGELELCFIRSLDDKSIKVYLVYTRTRIQ